MSVSASLETQLVPTCKDWFCREESLNIALPQVVQSNSCHLPTQEVLMPPIFVEHRIRVCEEASRHSDMPMETTPDLAKAEWT